MTLMRWWPAAGVLICLTAGCTVSVVDLRDSLDINTSSFRDKLAGERGPADEFVACTTRAYDERAALPADRTVTDGNRPSDGPVQAVHKLIARVKEEQPSHAESLHVLEETMADLTDTSSRRLDLHKLRKVVEVIKQWHVHVDFDEDALAEDGSRFAQLLLAYNKAYFGDVRFTAGPGTGSGIRAAVAVSSDGFIDRNGNVWRFPGLSTEAHKEPEHPRAVESGRVDSQRITSDLTRIFLEAFFDAAFREPAVESATALQVRWKNTGSAYPAFDAEHPPIPFEAFARVTRDALRAEAAVTSQVGKAVRGGGLFGTNNETVATGLETAAGVIAKKLVEHGGFCYFQTRQENERRKGGITG